MEQQEKPEPQKPAPKSKLVKKAILLFDNGHVLDSLKIYEKIIKIKFSLYQKDAVTFKIKSKGLENVKNEPETSMPNISDYISKKTKKKKSRRQNKQLLGYVKQDDIDMFEKVCIEYNRK